MTIDLHHLLGEFIRQSQRCSPKDFAGSWTPLFLISRAHLSEEGRSQIDFLQDRLRESLRLNRVRYLKILKECFNFHISGLSWVMECVTLVYASILMNGYKIFKLDIYTCIDIPTYNSLANLFASLSSQQLVVNQSIYYLCR